MEPNYPNEQPRQYEPAPQEPTPTVAPQPVPHRVDRPGRTMSIVGLIFAFVFLSPIGLVLSIVGLVKSHRAKQSNIVAILGIIFNALAIVGTVIAAFFITIALIAYSNVQAQARDTKRAADASALISAAEAYAIDNTGFYPRADAAGFRSDIAADSTITIDKSVTDKLSSSAPSSRNHDVYHITYCGGDREDATGLTVQYWNESTDSAKSIFTGRGCPGESTDDPSDSSDGTGSSDDTTECNSDTIQDGTSCGEGSSDATSLFN